MADVVIDICDTLYYSNTTFDYLRYISRLPGNDNLAKKLDPFLSKGLRFYWMAIREKFGKQDLIRSKALKKLKGISRNQLYSWADAFVSDYLANKQIKASHELLVKEAHSGANIYLASNSIDPVVSAIAKQLGNLPYVSTEMVYSNGICTGQISRTAHGNKWQMLQQQFTMNATDLTVISDNKSDFSLMKSATTRYCVVYNNQQKQFWSALNPTFIELS